MVAPSTGFPSGATNATLSIQAGQSITLSNWPAGDYLAEWYDPATAQLVGYSRATTGNSALILALPGFSSDLAGVLYPPPKLTPLAWKPSGAFQFQFDCETGGRYWIETSSNLTQWAPFGLFTNATGTSVLTDTGAGHAPSKYYRARQQR